MSTQRDEFTRNSEQMDTQVSRREEAISLAHEMSEKVLRMELAVAKAAPEDLLQELMNKNKKKIAELDSMITITEMMSDIMENRQ